jgi:hypothetical protein
VTASEYQTWLSTLTFEQRAAVEQAVGVVMDALLMLEGRISNNEAELKRQDEQIKYMNTRICELERITGLLV